MLAPLIDYITAYTPVKMSSADLSTLQQAFIPRKFRKKQFLLQEGEECKYIAFIVRGATRQYTVDDKGNEQILNLAVEGWWTSDRESFHRGTPSLYYIDAWEETDVLLLPKANGWYDRVNEIPIGDITIPSDRLYVDIDQRFLLSQVNTWFHQNTDI